MSDSIQIEQIEQPQQKTYGSNPKQVEISRLRTVAESEAEAPIERLRAAARLLSRFGASNRNTAVIKRVVKLFISSRDGEISERAKKLKIKLNKALALGEAASADFVDEVSTQNTVPETATQPVTTTVAEDPASQPQTEARVFGPVPIVPKPVYPPTNIVFPPPNGIYQLGNIDFDVVVDRLRKANALSQFSPGVGNDKNNEEFLRIALGLAPTQPVTHEVVQQLAYAFEFEPRRDEEYLSRGERNDYTTLMTLIHQAMFFYAHSTFGYNSLKHAPKNPNAPKSFLDEIRERSA